MIGAVTERSHAGDRLGPAARTGRSFRARAEARQREYRARILGAGWSNYGHWLDDEAVERGCNFVVREAHAAARVREAQGKGVARRTFQNMLSSQAMCFNVFAPLAVDLRLAVEVLSEFLPGIGAISSIAFEYTPPADLFRDQHGQSGVDCDLLIEVEWKDGTGGLIGIETKFVEEEFSQCGFRHSRRGSKGLPVCSDDVRVREDPSECLYRVRKGYLYWEVAGQARTLRHDALPSSGCPFGGAEWQLWVNHTLVHGMAARRGIGRSIFAVCAPAANERLLRDGVLERFAARLAEPHTFGFLPLDSLIDRIRTVTASRSVERRVWATALAERYGGI